VHDGPESSLINVPSSDPSPQSRMGFRWLEPADQSAPRSHADTAPWSDRSVNLSPWSRGGTVPL